MWIVQLALRRPYTIGVLACLLLLFGVMSARAMRSDVLPTIDIPVVPVVWNYPGLAAEEMEKRIIFPSERGYSTTVNGITRIESQSISGVGLLKIYFQPGSEIGTAISQINSVSSAASRNMPPGTHPPIVMPYNAANVPVAQITVTGRGKSEEDLVDYAFLGVRLRLFTIPGVATPAPYGGKNRQINVDVDPEAAAAHGCSARDIVTTLLESNPNLPAGTARLGDVTYDVTINNSPRSIEELERVVVKNVAGVPVLLGDVANVYDGTEVQESIVRVNGERATYLALVRKADASTLAVVDTARELLPVLQKAAPEGISLQLNFDQSVFVRAAISGVLHEAALSAALVTLLILVALGSLRSVLVVATSIPLSICVALVGLYATGQTLNVMTLGGVALAIGMLVDDATVEVENIHRNRQLGLPLRTAILDGARQVATPTLASTLCICVVFSPVVLLEGPVRYLFVPLALGVVFAMLASYFLSRTLVPTLSSLLLRDDEARVQSRLWRRMNAARDRGLLRIQQGYARVMASMFTRRGTVLSLGLVCLVVCGGYATTIGYELFPEVDVGLMRLHVRAPTGLRLEETERIATGIERIIRETIPEEELDTVSATIGVPTYYNIAFIQTDSIGTQDADILISLRGRHAPTAEYRRRLRDAIPRKFPGTHAYFQPADIVSQVLNFGTSAPIDVQIEGKNLEQGAAVARELRDRIREIPGAVDVRVAQVFSHPALEVDVDRDLASDLGVSQRDVAEVVLTSLNSSGLVQPSYWVDSSTNMSYLVAVQSPREKLTTIGDIERLGVRPSKGQVANTAQAASSTYQGEEVVPVSRLGGLTTIRPWQTSAIVNHENVQRVLDVRCNVEGRDLGSVAAEVERIVDRMEIPPNINVRVTGQVRMMVEAFHQLGLGLLLAGLLAYLIMVVLFQSWLDPVIVLGAVPGALGGILVALSLTHTSLNVESFMGALMAVGLAVANSILVVTFANDLRRARPEVSAWTAAVTSGRTRLRPVLMTAAAMVLGMIPMALGTGEGAEQNAPLGRAAIGGLVGATIATLFFVPILYSYLRRRPLRREEGDSTTGVALHSSEVVQ